MADTSKGHGSALGFRTHSGRTCAVLAAGRGDKIEILDRRHIVLHDPKAGGTKQPFHAAEPMPFAEAESHLALCRETSGRLAHTALMTLRTVSDRHGMSLSGICVIAASGRVLPDLRKILSSHALIHAAEGEFYRDALLGAAEAMKIAGHRLKAMEASPRIAALLGIDEDTLSDKLRALGKHIGRPWASDEKLATLAAWTLLAK